jgi:hypothetical protein
VLLASPAPAQVLVPGSDDASERAWYTSFMARFNARVAPSFRIDAELEAKLTRAWNGMVRRLEGRESAPSPLDQYPLLGFVDDRFVVMRITTPEGKESFVVRSTELQSAPTLSSTLTGYLDGTIYASLEAIANEERERIRKNPGYQPSLAQLAAHNPYQHGMGVRVPELGPFKNRVVVFGGPGGRLSQAETAEYERRKGETGPRQGLTVARPQRWGIAVETADLVERGGIAARYRVVREVAAVEDTFVGEGRRGVLLRRPRLGAVLRVSGCVGGCERAEAWTTIFPEVEEAGRSHGRQRRPVSSPFEVALPDDAQAGAPNRPF